MVQATGRRCNLSLSFFFLCSIGCWKYFFKGHEIWFQLWWHELYMPCCIVVHCSWYLGRMMKIAGVTLRITSLFFGTWWHVFFCTFSLLVFDWSAGNSGKDFEFCISMKFAKECNVFILFSLKLKITFKKCHSTALSCDTYYTIMSTTKLLTSHGSALVVAIFSFSPQRSNEIKASYFIRH